MEGAIATRVSRNWAILRSASVSRRHYTANASEIGDLRSDDVSGAIASR